MNKKKHHLWCIFKHFWVKIWVMGKKKRLSSNRFAL